jgi:hypothetical protein
MKDFSPATLPYLTEVTMDMAVAQRQGAGAGAATPASVRRVSDLPGDFPKVPNSLVGAWLQGGPACVGGFCGALGRGGGGCGWEARPAGWGRWDGRCRGQLFRAPRLAYKSPAIHS